MKIFNPDKKHASENHVSLYALYEVMFTIVDFSAALLFIIGSILFFNDSTVYTGTWMFLIGSVFFALKPGIRVIREFHLLRIKDTKTLGDKFVAEKRP